jgi:signal transduction histidine kinase
MGPQIVVQYVERGLGLEIARSFAAANGGSIGHIPREGGGTIALIDLPAARSGLGAGRE